MARPSATPSVSEARSNCSSLLSPPSSSMAVKHGPCLLTLEKRSRRSKEVPVETSTYLLLGAQDQRLGAEQDQFPYWLTGTFSGNCQETETCMVRGCHTQQPLQNHPSGHLGGRATP